MIAKFEIEAGMFMRSNVKGLLDAMSMWYPGILVKYVESRSFLYSTFRVLLKGENKQVRAALDCIKNYERRYA